MDLGQLLKKTVGELRELCRADGLDEDGTKADLAQRILLNTFSHPVRHAAPDGQEESAPAACNSTLEDDIRSKLDCPVCFEVMLPPIRQCREGHSFCDSCCTVLLRSASPRCPACRSSLLQPVARALQLEQVAAALRLKCKSCNGTCPYGDYAQHLQTCPKRPVDCPLARESCSWSGSVSELWGHLKENHGLKCVHAHREPGKNPFSAQLAVSEERDLGQRKGSRILVRIRPSPGARSGSTFVARLWCPGGSSPYVFAVQRLGRDKAGCASPWTCSVSLKSKHEQLSWTTRVADLEAKTDVWGRSSRQLDACVGSVLVIPQKQMRAFGQNLRRAGQPAKTRFPVSLKFCRARKRRRPSECVVIDA